MADEIYRDIVAFITVARARSFTRAAAELGVSQSALSHTIRQLEERLGLRLLTRTTRSVSPTEAGERLLERVSPRFAVIADVLASLRQLSSKIAGTVRITASDFAFNAFVWPRLSGELLKYPDLKLEIVNEPELKDIIAERFDAGIRPGDRIGKNMASVPVSPDLQTVIVATPAYFRGNPIPLTPGDLSQHSCINSRFSMKEGIKAWELKKGDINLTCRVEGPLIFNSVYAALDAALAGYGLAYLPEMLARPWLESGRLQRVLEAWCPWQPGYHIFYSSERQLLPALSLIIETLRYEPQS
ncbi:LysR family transcriptional regulator [Klebsiella oxytoca]|uniref:LysR family transcriptional regulator n=2 Tax=Klebsiella oxytoca TaxID=571 RepID=UPI0007DAB4DF|nr:LysR family transcriptional regulator [Klebsiella oxytoca]ELG4816772.1 LysR family transcriptional regulator [Klebsiella oxytoca]ELK5561607.1 LysR family transcriptional regulator [Klebsiella oxytoca]ELK5573865.1 LysR family transcriptional regulator [Klebsiella oxytoca]ELM1663815.1 LysR family transcriptional regulator [Klebsiella oxytoca]MCY3428803.1 LysR family transcriptional regulator [Klebsiella oxytoca]